MKKISVVLAAAGLTASLGAYATLPTDAAPFSLNIPNLKSGITITLEGLLVRPDASNTDFGTTNTLTVTPINGPIFPSFALSNSQTLNTTNPNYDFGFRVGLGYVFPDSGNDVQLNWTHFNHSYNNDGGLGDGDVLVTSFGTPIFNPALFGLVGDVDANSNTKFQFDSIDLDVGQYLNVGTRLQTRMFGGLRYAYVKQNQTDNYSTSLQDVDDGDAFPFFAYAEQDAYTSKFNGLGPRLGFQAAYNVWDCFGVTGSIAGALLVGKVKTTTNNSADIDFIDPDTGVIVADFEPRTSANNNQWRVVPEVDARLGLNYTWTFGAQSALTLEAGYQVTQYFHAVDKIHNEFDADSFTVVSTRTTSDVGFDGPYLSLNYRM